MGRHRAVLFLGLVYDLGGLLVVFAVAIGSGLNRAPVWQALIAPVIYVVIVGFLDPEGHTYSSSIKVRRAVLLGAVAFIVALVGFYIGPGFVNS